MKIKRIAAISTMNKLKMLLVLPVIASVIIPSYSTFSAPAPIDTAKAISIDIEGTNDTEDTNVLPTDAIIPEECSGSTRDTCFPDSGPTDPDPTNPDPINPPSTSGFSESTKQLLREQGLSDDIGKTMTISNACSRSVFGGWTSGYKEDQCTWQLPKSMEEDGWIIVRGRANVISTVGKAHRSGTGTDSTGSNSTYSFSSKSVGPKIEAAIKKAIELGDVKAETELKLAYQKIQEFSTTKSSSHNTAILKVWSQSGAVTRAGIEAQLDVDLVKLK